MRRVLHLCGLVMLILLHHDALANGFKNPPDGPAGFARSGGKAYTGDASAIFHNPANLMDLDDTSLTFTLTSIYGRATVDGLTGRSEQTRDNFAALPNIYFAGPYGNDSRFVAGVGINVPFGRSTTWKKEGIFKYSAPYFAILQVTNINPAIAMKLGDAVSLGMGFDLYYSSLNFRQQYPWFATTGNPASPDGKMEVDGDGIGYGANVGVTVQVTPRQRLAVTHRSSVKVEYEGDFTISNIPATRPDVLHRSRFKTAIDYPSITALGYGIEITDNLRLELDVEWLEFSQYQTLDLDVGANNAKLALLPAALPQNWDNSWTYGVGLDWKLAKGKTLRFGYSYLESPIPDNTFSPVIVDADKNVFSVGFDFVKRSTLFNLSYAIAIPNERHIRNHPVPVFNGDYDFLTHLIGFTCQHRF